MLPLVSFPTRTSWTDERREKYGKTRRHEPIDRTTLDTFVFAYNEPFSCGDYTFRAKILCVATREISQGCYIVALRALSTDARNRGNFPRPRLSGLGTRLFCNFPDDAIVPWYQKRSEKSTRCGASLGVLYFCQGSYCYRGAGIFMRLREIWKCGNTQNTNNSEKCIGYPGCSSLLQRLAGETFYLGFVSFCLYL